MTVIEFYTDPRQQVSRTRVEVREKTREFRERIDCRRRSNWEKVEMTRRREKENEKENEETDRCWKILKERGWVTKKINKNIKGWQKDKKVSWEREEDKSVKLKELIGWERGEEKRQIKRLKEAKRERLNKVWEEIERQRKEKERCRQGEKKKPIERKQKRKMWKWIWKDDWSSVTDARNEKSH